MSDPAPLTKEDRDALEAYDLAQLAHKHAGWYFPSLAEMEKDTTKPSTIDSIKQHNEVVRTRYANFIDAMADEYTERYYEEALDRYESYDASWVPPAEDPEDLPESFKREHSQFMDVYHGANLRGYNDVQSQFTTAVRVAQSAQVDQLKPHAALLTRLEASERARLQRERADAERARLAAESRFPRTITEWEGMTNLKRKYFVAFFLTFSASEKEEKMLQYKWTWDDVDPLINIYKTNESFRKQLGAFRESFTSTDPRRPSTS